MSAQSCPGCKRVLDRPGETGRWRVLHHHLSGFPESAGIPGRRIAANTTCLDFCGYQHEGQNLWEDCPGVLPTETI